MCLRTHASLMKFTTSEKMLKSVWLIHKSKVSLIITQIDMVGNTYASMVFCNMGGICSSIDCLQRGNLILLSLFTTRWWNHVNSTLNIAMKPLPIYKTESWWTLVVHGHLFLGNFSSNCFLWLLCNYFPLLCWPPKSPFFKFLHTPLYFINFAKCSCI
jgi:hypothetical protein